MRAFFQRILGRGEARTAFGSSVSAFTPGPTAAGQMVSARVVENLATVTACVGAISSALASMPALLYRVTDAGKVELPGHPVARLLRQPNRHQTWSDFLEWLIGQALLYGNGLAVVEYDGRGAPMSLTPIPWPNVQAVMLPSGRLRFDVVQYSNLWGGTGSPRSHFADEVLLVSDRSDDGILGRSRLSRAPEVLGAALALQHFTGAMWANQAALGGILTSDSPRVISDEEAKALSARWAQLNAGPENARRTVVLGGGLKFQPITVSPEDAEVLASRRFTVEELCRLYNVPPPIVQDYTHNTFTNASQAATWFAQLSLAPWAGKVEAAFARTLLAPDLQLCIDLSGLMRGDYSARWAANVAAVGAGILTPDEVREQEGYGPLPAGAQQQGGASA